MIKDRVGEVRSTSYVLPSTSHTFGKACQKDNEGAGEGECCVIVMALRGEVVRSHVVYVGICSGNGA